MGEYSAALKWCLRCDVGWGGLGHYVCWLCGLDDSTHAWGWTSGEPEFRKVS